jgi:Zn-dependent M28 family amino/carboxypeptidase
MKKIIPFLILALFTFSCGHKEKEDTYPAFELTSNGNVPKFNGDTAYAFTAKQVSFGPRNPGSGGHSEALNYFYNQFEQYTDSVQLQQFSYSGYNNEVLNLTNIIASFNPDDTNRIMITAHWDTRPRSDNDQNPTNVNLPILGANDGASGCGVILELARLLKNNKVKYGIDLVLLDGEDYGKDDDLDNFCIGTKYFTENMNGRITPAFAINLDMVGDKNASFPVEGYSNQYAPDIVNMVWNIADQIGAADFIRNNYSQIYDDHLILNQGGIKAVDIIDADLVGNHTAGIRRNYWHTQNDNMKNISAQTLQQVGDVLTHLIYSLKFTKHSS